MSELFEICRVPNRPDVEIVNVVSLCVPEGPTLIQKQNTNTGQDRRRLYHRDTDFARS